MNSNNVNYQRIADAIEYIRDHFQVQPDLEQVASQLHVSPHHFQRIFTDWAGVSPKKFLQYISIEHAKQILNDSHNTLSQAAFETGLSGTGRLHDLFISIEGMTPGEYKSGGENLIILYDFINTPFGKAICASTKKGVCFMAFDDDEASAVQSLFQQFPQASFKRELKHQLKYIEQVFDPADFHTNHLKLHIRGTPFQLKVWEALLKIPSGKLTSYGNLAKSINHPKASRAVGTAIGSNPVAYLIPCHRVIQSGGIIGGYRWGSTRKKLIIGWEVSRNNADHSNTATKAPTSDGP